MAAPAHDPTSELSPTGALARFAAAFGVESGRRGPPPVETWNPPYCGEIDMRIAADGSWHYNGSPIARPALVRLFSSILRRDPERHVLVTPVERVGIVVEDAPFLAVAMVVHEAEASRRLAFRTNVDDVVEAGPNHPLRFARDEHDGIKPYIRIRGDLWARLTRAVALDLIALGEEQEADGEASFGVAAGGAFFVIAHAAEGSELP